MKKEPMRFCKTRRNEFMFVTSHARTIVFIIYIKYNRSYTTIFFLSLSIFLSAAFQVSRFCINSDAFLLAFFDTIV